MTGEKYLFIDGGYLLKRYSETMREFFGVDAEIDFDFLRRSIQAAQGILL